MFRLTTALTTVVLLIFVTGCSEQDVLPEVSVTQAEFGKTPDGKAVYVYTLKNAKGMEVEALTFGGIIRSLRVPDRFGRVDDVVLGFDSLDGYLKNPAYFGGIIGRYANRIARGKFVLDGKTYELAVNNAPNHLHGGIKGFDKVVWGAESFKKDKSVGVVLTYSSPDGEEGYPGTVDLRVTYTLDAHNTFTVDYEAKTDAPTPLNLTQHSYFNLAGEGSGDVLGHVVLLTAGHLTPIDSMLIPTGQIRSVAGTPFDFRTPHAIGERIEANNEQLRFGNGYDHNFQLDRDGPGIVLAAHVEEPTSGRILEVFTTEPGVQFYTGNFLDGTLIGKSGEPYGKRSGFCLETQHFPDSPNHPEFPTTILRPGETFRSQTVFAFAAR